MGRSTARSLNHVHRPYAPTSRKQQIGIHDYSSFDALDGTHPWMNQVPEGCVLYPTRILTHGRVSYFNYDLAIEMGLISPHHPRRLNKQLENKLIETFSLRIVNEYDQTHHVSFPKATLKKNKYMATRYLQLQHDDKTGRTSGDGRCVWNGVWLNQGKAWDISSRGTGVTQLAPGAVEAGKPLKSGNTRFGYGCGLAEIDELYGTAIMAEIFHRNGINTERILTIIDLGKGMGIGVRAAPNLLRPAHLFMYLKQGKTEPLRRATDFLIDRQHQNGEWTFSTSHRQKYDLMLQAVCEEFAKFAAYLERDYIFAWLDWDGDNVLANAGIIDYGSVRQFGLRHDQYRYDDVDRYSTNLNEQKQKAKETVQTFVQLVDFLQTGKKRPLAQLSGHPILKTFDERFKWHLLDRFLYQIGFASPQRKILLNRHRLKVQKLYQSFTYFERIKTYKKLTKVADGVNRPAIFNLRALAGILPQRFLDTLEINKHLAAISAKEFFQIILTSQAGRKDRKLGLRLKKRIERFQGLYLGTLKLITTPETLKMTLNNMNHRASQINRNSRVTGNAIIYIVEEILKYRRRGLTAQEIQDTIEQFIHDQTLCPDVSDKKSLTQSKGLRKGSQKLMRTFLTVVEGCKEDI